ncbi:MAG: GNAT family N-acetyltransferase [Thermomicrobiales bacterium]|nr:GNAT family N-acetyltransferase [Thermomicrobiales bacterium]
MIRFPSAITTERLIIRRWRDTDAQLLWEAVDESREHLATYLPWVRFYRSPTDASDFIARARREWPDGYQLPLAILDRATGRLLGGSGYHSLEPTVTGWRTLEIGYWLRAGEEGKGYMRETVRAQIRLAFELGIENLLLFCDNRNRPSYRVAEACGFRREAILRRDTRTHIGELRDSRRYALLPEEARELIATWGDERFELEWSDSPFERPVVAAPATDAPPELPDLPVIVTELLRLDPVNLHEPGYQFTVVDRAGSRHLGLAAIIPGAADVPSFALRWSFKSADEPIEFGIELTLALLKLTFEELGAERVVMWLPVTAGSEREIAEIAGFVNEGTVRAARSPITGAIGDFVVYSVIREDL